MKNVDWKNAVILILIIPLSSTSAQNLKLGFQLESFQYFTNTDVINRTTNLSVSNYSSAFGAFAPTSLYLKFDVGITNELMLEFKPGFLFADDYTGYEAGIFSKYKIYKFANLIAFFNYHANNDYSSNTGGATSKGISLLGAGVGVDICEMIVLELLYSIPISESQIGYTPSYKNDYSLRTETNLKSIIKLGIGFSWSIAN
ncbi:MAG: hypothetical protein IPM56_17925 [Ignavibacteriales bacterium]|nr:MAG: hypothetical protein IPM56_17925 [Ignavibacteriales bacterium]